jgi:hypothetical protein
MSETVTNESFFDRMKSAIGGIIVGIIMIFVAIGIIFWNERNSIITATGLAEGAKMVVSIKSDKADAANDNKLVHTSGTATTDETLSDKVFGISEKAIQLKREVEMYQWKENEKKETKKKTGGGTTTTTTYSYEKKWAEGIINSGSFHDKAGHENPTSMPYKSETFKASKVTLGAFTLDSSQVSQINNFQALSVTDATLPASLKSQMKMNGGGYYIGPNPSSPQVGDMKITFKFVKPTTASLVAKQTGTTFQPYEMKNGFKINILSIGEVAAADMFKQAQSANTMMTWIFRIVTFVLMIIGFGAIFKPISVLADIIPFIGNIVEGGLGIFSFFLALGLWMLMVSIAWIIVRPLLGIILLLIAGGAIGGLIFLCLKKKG